MNTVWYRYAEAHSHGALRGLCLKHLLVSIEENAQETVVKLHEGPDCKVWSIASGCLGTESRLRDGSADGRAVTARHITWEGSWGCASVRTSVITRPSTRPGIKVSSDSYHSHFLTLILRSQHPKKERPGLRQARFQSWVCSSSADSGRFTEPYKFRFLMCKMRMTISSDNLRIVHFMLCVVQRSFAYFN